MHVYDFNGDAWDQVGSDIDGEASFDISGWSVSLSTDGTHLAAGAPGNDDNDLSAGHVRVYDFNGTAWSQVGTDIDGEGLSDLSGWSPPPSAVAVAGLSGSVRTARNEPSGPVHGRGRKHSIQWRMGHDRKESDGENDGDKRRNNLAEHHRCTIKKNETDLK